MPKLSRIQIYPIKSFDPLIVDDAVVLVGGALENDRRFALCDERSEYINGKRTEKMHLLRSEFDLPSRTIDLNVKGTDEVQRFELDVQNVSLTDWLSDFFGLHVMLIENPDGGFPDDMEYPGPTVVSTGTLAAVSDWFGGIGIDEARRRFRANLEIDAMEPFWEDRLVADAAHVVRFAIGETEFLGMNPCQRCIVPTRNSTTGEATLAFATTFAIQRKELLPDWAPRNRFDHFYRLAVNTRLSRGRPGVLAVGDEVRILGTQ